MRAEVLDDAHLSEAVSSALPEAVVVYLFGSQAGDAARPGSDVDLAVLAAEPIAPGRLLHARQELVSRLRRDVDLIDLARASTVMRAQVVSTGRLLRNGDPSFCEHFEATVYSAYARLNEERREILARIREEGRVHGR
jgi:predicted nucleotidyltransferase